jgi:biopolymer transport protein ExbD
MIRSDTGNHGASIEMTPIIDMVFLLLIFFLVATTFHQTEREMQVALPQAAFAGPISTSLREIIINVDTDGNIIVSGRTISPQDLQVLVEEAVATNPQQKVTVRGDHRTAYANVVRVLDICKGSGVQEPYLDTVLTKEP